MSEAGSVPAPAAPADDFITFRRFSVAVWIGPKDTDGAYGEHFATFVKAFGEEDATKDIHLECEQYHTDAVPVVRVLGFSEAGCAWRVLLFLEEHKTVEDQVAAFEAALATIGWRIQ